MRISILCIGRARRDPAAALCADYVARLPWPVVFKAFEERRPLGAPERVAREAALLQGAVPKGAVTVALDERGAALSSRDFAKRLGAWIEQGRGDIAFLIGGADGLQAKLRDDADLVLSLGAMTWPHRLVPPLLAEQLYRAHTILSGHPYHRD
ncbi:MAG TPA: 23S rRNA (pseudouridine(1915)-N(3))-methyltransferase RlmH [Candidatus Sulfotelmatobacter sp.]|nr:23S rRNA (pseudouridine(1915)-N(3))-methyltransferase RlmH [Candidatus Sulfotelmatobacter sp.]